MGEVHESKIGKEKNKGDVAKMNETKKRNMEMPGKLL